LYSGYINRYDVAVKVVTKHATNSSFQRFLEKAQAESKSNLGLMAYLIMPVQRIPRYVLLLREVLKHTPSTEVNMKESLNTSLKAVENIASHINEQKRRVDNHLQLTAVSHKLGKSLAGTNLDIQGNTERWFVREGSVKELKNKSKHVKERVFLIFSDMVLWATDPGYKYKGHIFLKDINVERVRVAQVCLKPAHFEQQKITSSLLIPTPPLDPPSRLLCLYWILFFGIIAHVRKCKSVFLAQHLPGMDIDDVT
jgi:hypothetical protein